MKIATVAADILADAHDQLLQTLVTDVVYVTKANSRHDLQAILHHPSPFTYQIGRHRFSPRNVRSIQHTGTDWLVVLH